MLKKEYTVIYEPAEEGGYIVHIPILNGLATQGETLEEARAMAKDAIKCYIESLQELNLPIPDDTINAQPSVLNLEKLAISLP